MALRQRRVIGAEHEREMREARRPEAERPIEQDLARRVRDVILAADHVRHLHQRIVDHDREVVLRAAVGADDDRIADDVGVEGHVAADEILERHVDVLGHAEADDGALAGVETAPGLIRRQVAAGAVVHRRTAGGEIRAAIVLELLRRAEAVVGLAAGEQLVGVRGVEVQPLRLAVGAGRAADVGPLVPLEAEPAQVLQDAVLGLFRRSLGVGVFDAEDERAVVAAREQPVEQRRAGVADVQRAGRAGGETHSHRPMSDTRGPMPDVRRSATAWAAMALAAPDRIDALVGLALDADAVDARAERARQVVTHLLDGILDPGPLQDHRDVQVPHFVARVVHHPRRVAEQREAVGVFPTRVRVGEVAADVAECDGAENRVGRRVAGHITIRWPSGPLSNGMVTPPITSGRPSTRRCRS